MQDHLVVTEQSDRADEMARYIREHTSINPKPPPEWKPNRQQRRAAARADRKATWPLGRK